MSKHQVILCIVNSGFTDEAMAAAKQCGARGGTVFHARGTVSKEAEKFFNIPSQKTDVLIMGADDENINLTDKEQIKNKIRAEYNIDNNAFLIVSGGKIDKNKNFTQLMNACGRLGNTHLLLFGNVDEGISDEFDSLLKKYENITHIGWLDANKVYEGVVEY